MPRQMLRYLLLASGLSLLAIFAAFSGGSQSVRADVGGVYSSAPVFMPGQVITITVLAEDDDGGLTIISNLSGSTLSIINCTGVGSDQAAGKCDGTGKAAVTGNGTAYVTIDTTVLDADTTSEPLTVTLSMTATCTTLTVVTVNANQPGNVGPDDVTINCQPATPTPTPTSTPLPTATPRPLSPTPIPFFPTLPPPPPQSQVLTSTTPVILPPNTGDGGLLGQ